MQARVAIRPYGVTLVLTDNRKAFQRLSGASDDGSCGMCVGTGDGYVIGVFDGELSTLVHELTHLILMVAEHNGIDPFSSRGEPLAYLMDDLFTEATRALWRAGKSK